jgi:aromatase
MVYIDAIINYFKAWEYFLLRPETHWESSLERKHSMAVKELQRHVKQMLESIAITRSSNASKRGLFIDQLREIHKHHNPDSLVQSALEMMIAGTDTSSVTAYYALLGISPNRTLQADIRQDILSRGASKSKLLRSIIDETLRFKPGKNILSCTPRTKMHSS